MSSMSKLATSDYRLSGRDGRRSCGPRYTGVLWRTFLLTLVAGPWWHIQIRGRGIHAARSLVIS